MNTKEITQLMDKTQSLIDELKGFYDKLKLECSSNEDETFSDSSSESDSSDDESDNETKESNKKIISKNQSKNIKEKDTPVNIDNKCRRKVISSAKEILGLSSEMINYEDLRKAVDSYIVANQLEEDGEITLDRNLKLLFNSRENSIKKKGPGLANNIRKNLFVDE
jgi:hypothetical protein